MVPTDVVVTFENVTLDVPVTVALVETVAMDVLLLVTVTVTGLGGVAPREMKTEVSRSPPTVTLPMLMLGAVTVAVIWVKLPGVEKPAGVPTAIIEVPAARGSNAVLACESPPLKTSGLVVMV